MKLLLVTPFYMPGVGGSSRLLREIVDNCIKCGHEVAVLTYLQETPEICAAFDALQSYPIIRIPSQKRQGLSSLLMFAKIITLSARYRFERILCGTAFPSGVLAFAAQFVTHTPYVIYSHGEDVTMVQTSPRNTALLKGVLDRAKFIMTNSSFSREEVRRLGISPNKVICIPPGIDPLLYENASPEVVETLRSRFGLQGKRVILTLARLSPRKGHDMIIRALPPLCARMPDLHYLIVGKGDTQELYALAENEGIADRVTFVDYVTESELPALYNLCEIYAMVSRWDPVLKEVEGFGICYLEAAACGKPCIAGSAGGSKDAVEDGVTGLIVDPTSRIEIQQALQRLLDDPERATAMGELGRRRVREHFQRDDLLSKITQVVTRSYSAGKSAL